MSHKYTRQEIDSAKIQILQAERDEPISANDLYKQAIGFLDGTQTDHKGDFEPQRPVVEAYDE